MIQTLGKNWWLLALCGLLEALYCLVNFFTQRADGSLALRTFVSHRGTVVDMGLLALAAGICAVAAAIWNSRSGKSWLLVLNGLALSALGVILAFWTGPVRFNVIALLIIAMAVTLGVYLMALARASRRHPVEWLLASAGVVSFGFALAFLAFVFGWMKLQPSSPAQSLHWVGSYFAFSALCILWLAFRLMTQAPSQSGRQDLPALGNPRPVH